MDLALCVQHTLETTEAVTFLTSKSIISVLIGYRDSFLLEGPILVNIRMLIFALDAIHSVLFPRITNVIVLCSI